MEKKVCSKCGVEKKLDDFSKRKCGSKILHRGVCKQCKVKPKERKEKFCGTCNMSLGRETLNKLCESCLKINKKESYQKSNILKSLNLEEKYIKDVELERQAIFKSDSKDELWEFIPGFAGKYQASDLGRIRCLPTTYRTPNGSLRKSEYYFPKNINCRGYLQHNLADLEGNNHLKGTHKWVMLAFRGESELQVDHINGVKEDNRLENLRYVTARENTNFRKDTNPDNFTSSLYGTYKQRDKWISYIKINKFEHYLGAYDSELEGHNKYMEAWNDWENYGKLPSKYINTNKTSQIDGVDFHGASGKWRVRAGQNRDYIGIFETESLAERVLNIVNFITSRNYDLSKDVIKTIRRKYTEDKRRRLLINTETDEIFYSIQDAGNSLGINAGTLHSKLNKNLVNDTPIRYL